MQPTFERSSTVRIFTFFLFCRHASFLLYVKVVGHLGTLVLEGDVVEGAEESLQGLLTLLGFELAFPDFDGVPSLCFECQDIFVVTFLVTLDFV